VNVLSGLRLLLLVRTEQKVLPSLLWMVTCCIIGWYNTLDLGEMNERIISA
jgi:hypothetical protein